jgi:hypothetical protein
LGAGSLNRLSQKHSRKEGSDDGMALRKMLPGLVRHQLKAAND